MRNGPWRIPKALEPQPGNLEFPNGGGGNSEKVQFRSIPRLFILTIDYNSTGDNLVHSLGWKASSFHGVATTIIGGWKRRTMEICDLWSGVSVVPRRAGTAWVAVLLAELGRHR